MGFDHQNSTRTYRFDRIENGARIARLVISADLDLFLKNGVAIQEGPVLCAKKLASDPGLVSPGTPALTNEDLLAFTTARTELEARKAETRARKPKRSPDQPSSPFGRFTMGGR
jgi:hypothetical protein